MVLYILVDADGQIELNSGLGITDGNFQYTLSGTDHIGAKQYGPFFNGLVKWGPTFMKRTYHVFFRNPYPSKSNLALFVTRRRFQNFIAYSGVFGIHQKQGDPVFRPFSLPVLVTP